MSMHARMSGSSRRGWGLGLTRRGGAADSQPPPAAAGTASTRAHFFPLLSRTPHLPRAPAPPAEMFYRRIAGRVVAAAAASAPCAPRAANMSTAAGGAAKLWGGRFTGKTDPLMEAFNNSIGFDRRFWRVDIRGSIEYAKALARAGILTGAEASAIEGGLQKVRGAAGGARTDLGLQISCPARPCGQAVRVGAAL
jgi:hypothetical protein